MHLIRTRIQLIALISYLYRRVQTRTHHLLSNSESLTRGLSSLSIACTCILCLIHSIIRLVYRPKTHPLPPTLAPRYRLTGAKFTVHPCHNHYKLFLRGLSSLSIACTCILCLIHSIIRLVYRPKTHPLPPTLAPRYRLTAYVLFLR